MEICHLLPLSEAGEVLSEPSNGITYTSSVPDSREVNAIHLPSGENWPPSALDRAFGTEVLYYHFLPGFMDKYNAHMVESLRASAQAAAVPAKEEKTSSTILIGIAGIILKLRLLWQSVPGYAHPQRYRTDALPRAFSIPNQLLP